MYNSKMISRPFHKCALHSFIFAFSLSIFGCSTLSRSPASNQDTVKLSASLKECFAPELTLAIKSNININGHPLSANQTKNLQWISHCVFPFLPGSPEERAEMVAKATWWSLREGILGLSVLKAFRYSNCNTADGDQIQSNKPIKDCAQGRAWQVGITAGQVPNYSMKELDTVLQMIFPRISPTISEEEVLDWTANLAGFPAGTPEHEEILKSTNYVKRSWLLRNPLIGTIVVSRSEVNTECLLQQKKWCTSGSYSDAIHFSRTMNDVRKSIADLKVLFLQGTLE